MPNKDKKFTDKISSRKPKEEAVDSQEQQKEVEQEQEDSQKRIADLELVVKDLNDKLLRSLAETDNIRRRSQQDLEKANKYAISNFASDLVAVMENFYLAVENMPTQEVEKDPKVKNFADAIIMTKKELTKTFEKNGIKRISPLKEEFDHNSHEAISRIESDQEEGTVVQVVQAGYSIGDRLIRPALVVVSEKKTS